MKRLTLRKEDCYKSLIDFYDCLAELEGVDTKSVQYDVKKICCTKSVADEIFQFYKEQGNSGEQAAALWLCCGPKASMGEDGFMVGLEDGFFSFTEK